MDFSIENFLLTASILLLISIIAGKTSYKFGVPTLILFVAIGILAGSEGIGGIYFDDPKIARFIGIIALNFILFSGGLDTNWTSIKPILWQGISLSSLGVLLTALSLGVFVHLITDFTLLEGLLLGAIVSSTDAAAVFSILRSKNLALKTQIRPTLELESGSNDPMAYALTIAFLGLITNPEMGLLQVLPIFLAQMFIGALAGFLFGKLSELIINKIKLDFEALYPILVMALMFLTYSATTFLKGNGFLAVYLCAVFIGNKELIHKKTILKMFDGFAWLMQIVLFLTLGLLVNPSQIVPLAGLGLLISVFLMFIARPLSVMISLLPFKMKFRRRAYISWIGLRGAVPIVFATYPLLANIDKANLIFNIVFFVSLSSVLIQGTTLSIVAKWLHVALPVKIKPKSPVDIFLSDHAKSRMLEVTIPENSFVVGKKIIDINFPKNSIIAMINRGSEFITPSGSTKLKANDVLIVLSDSEEGITKVYNCLSIDNSDKKCNPIKET